MTSTPVTVTSPTIRGILGAIGEERRDLLADGFGDAVGASGVSHGYGALQITRSSFANR